MKRDGQPVEWAETPPVPLPGDEPKAPEEARPARAKKPAAKRKKSA